MCQGSLSIKGIHSLIGKRSQGNIFPQNPTNQRCVIYMGVQDRLFKHLMDENEEVKNIFYRWVEVKDRPEYMHDGRRMNQGF